MTVSPLAIHCTRQSDYDPELPDENLANPLCVPTLDEVRRLSQETPFARDLVR
jgi:hypothetical protein